MWRDAFEARHLATFWQREEHERWGQIQTDLQHLSRSFGEFDFPSGDEGDQTLQVISSLASLNSFEIMGPAEIFDNPPT